MKANEVLEKIYIQPDAQDCWFMVNNLNNTLIEYIRTDAFIEKAKKWMLTHTYMFESMEEVDLYIEMFIKEMEGE